MSARSQVGAPIDNSANTRSINSRSIIWLGRVVVGLVTVFLLLDAVMHLAVPQPVVDAMTHLGYPLGAARAIGVVELVCLLLYLVPATAPVGAVLLTGLLGGAVAAHVRVGDPIFETYVFPVVIGALIWGGLALRDARVRACLGLFSG